jgi:hypothetical protein
MMDKCLTQYCQPHTVSRSTHDDDDTEEGEEEEEESDVIRELLSKHEECLGM